MQRIKRKPSLDRLRRRVSILNLCAEHGIALDRRDGSDLVGRCPFHGQACPLGRDEPSFIVNPHANRWRCTHCGRNGGLVLLLMGLEHLNRAQAVDRLLVHPGLIDRATWLRSPDSAAAKKGGSPCHGHVTA